MQINKAEKDMLNTFQHKGLRQILKLETTFVNRANSVEKLFSIANEIINTPDNDIEDQNLRANFPMEIEKAIEQTKKRLWLEFDEQE